MRQSVRSSSLLSVRRLLASDRSLAVALPEAELLAALNRRLAAQVPAAVASVCRVAGLQAQTVVVYCAHGSAASRLRAQATSLAEALSSPKTPVSEVKIRIRADWAVAERPEKHDLSPTALEAFECLESVLPENPLRDAVQQLLNRRRKNP